MNYTKNELKVMKNDRGFYFVELGHLAHGRVDKKVWVSQSLVTQNKNGVDVICFPARAAITRTEKGNIVFKPSDDAWSVLVHIPCGYRGSASFDILNREDVIDEVWYSVFKSPMGSLGADVGGLFTIKNSASHIKVVWKRAGRLYGSPPSGLMVIHRDGTVEAGDPDEDDIANALRD